MRILITGSTGLIGTPLSQALHARGAELYCLTRTPLREATPRTCYLGWNGLSEPTNLPEGIDLVIHLSGENVAAKRWSKAQRHKIYESRVVGTAALISALAKQKKPPARFISASAIGIYGNRGDEILHEKSSVGEGFLADTAHGWEKAALGAEKWGAAVTLLRFGVVLSRKGGALKKMLPAFQWGVAGRLGDGQQYMSWISLRDAVAAILFAIDKDMTGAINICTPESITNQQFTNELASSLKRPAILHVPAFMLKLLLGEMADALLLTSTRVMPQRLLESGFQFSDSTIESVINSEI
jgi:uncharacterized protein